jgi:hypothetical protein
MAMLLLAVLLAHLTFMSSPLHAASVGADELPGSAVGGMPEHGVTAEQAASPMEAEHFHHCALEWTPPPAGPMLVAVSAELPSRIDLAAASTVSPAFDSRVVEPPRLPDAQALLQVFRI